MKKINNIWAYLRRHKYLLTIIIGVLTITIFSEHSLRKYIIYQLQISELKSEIESYQEQYERDSIKYRALTDNPKGAERIAREKYLMKRPNEDIFLMSIDKTEKEK